MVALGGDGGVSDDENKIRIVIFYLAAVCATHI
jgi:hypothetical protein